MSKNRNYDTSTADSSNAVIYARYSLKYRITSAESVNTIKKQEE